MNKIYFKVEDDVVIKYTPMPVIGENICKSEVVMTKEIFQECYKKWVEPQENDKITIDEAATRFTEHLTSGYYRNRNGNPIVMDAGSEE